MGMDTRKYFSFSAILLALSVLAAGCSYLPLQGRGIPQPLASSERNDVFLSEDTRTIEPPLSSRDPFLDTALAIQCRDDDPFLSIIRPASPNAETLPFGPPSLPARTIPREESEDALGLALDVEEERKPLAWDEQEAILIKDLWAPNIELRRWEENGMKNPSGDRDQAQLKKMNNILRLNMSDRDRQKQQKNLYDYSTGLVSTWRWFHTEIERMDGLPRLPADEFLISKKYIGKNYRILRANAAILLGRSGDSRVKQYLMRVVENEELSVYLRCAAVETLGTMDAVEVDDLLSLLDSAKEREMEKRHPQREESVVQTVVLPKIWEEILVALAIRIAPWEHRCFLEPFSAKNYDNRLATAKLWRRQTPPDAVFDPTGPKVKLPDRLMEYAVRETAPEIRAEMLLLMGKWKEPKLLDLAKTDLHQVTTVRNAAMDALAEMGCREAVPLVKEKLTDTAPLNRAKAVETLRKLGCYDDVFRLSDDPAWQVRIEVAKAIAERRTPQSYQKAKQYLTTGNDRVQKEALEAVADWPIEEGGPLMLEALKSPVQATRIRAAALLSEYFESARYYNVGAMPDKMAEEHRDLVAKFQGFLQSQSRDTRILDGQIESTAVFSDDKSAKRTTVEFDRKKLPEIRRLLDDWNRAGRSYRERQPLEDRLLLLGDQLSPLLNHLYEEESRNIPASLDSVLASVDPWFERIVRLDTNNNADRRQTAAELARWSRNRTSNAFTASRIRDFCRDETDSLVLRPLLETLKNADEKSAILVSRELLEHPSADLRRQACFLLGESGDVGDLTRLAEALHDENRAVVRAALEAMLILLPDISSRDRSRGRDEIRKGLDPLLFDMDPYLQADMAGVQFLLGIGAGEDSLRRLARNKEAKVRQHAAKRIGDTGSPVFTAALIELLDDSNGSVRSEALDALPRIVGRDVTEDIVDSYRPGDARLTKVRVDRWKKWFERNSGEAGRQSRRYQPQASLEE